MSPTFQLTVASVHSVNTGVSADEAVLGANIDAETLHNSLGYRLVYLKRLALSAQSPLFVLLA